MSGDPLHFNFDLAGLLERKLSYHSHKTLSFETALIVVTQVESLNSSPVGGFFPFTGNLPAADELLQLAEEMKTAGGQCFKHEAVFSHALTPRSTATGKSIVQTPLTELEDGLELCQQDHVQPDSCSKAQGVSL